MEVEAVAKVLERAQIPPTDSALGHDTRALRGGGIRGYLRFLGAITKTHPGVVRQISTDLYPKVSLFLNLKKVVDRSNLPFNDKQRDYWHGLIASTEAR